jgi:hypothetical protein
MVFGIVCESQVWFIGRSWFGAYYRSSVSFQQAETTVTRLLCADWRSCRFNPSILDEWVLSNGDACCSYRADAVHLNQKLAKIVGFVFYFASPEKCLIPILV